MLLNANGYGVMEATLRMPQWGVVNGDLVVDTNGVAVFTDGAAVTLATADGTFSVKGTVRAKRNGVFIDSSRFLFVGGAGGLSLQTVPKHYGMAGVTLKLPLDDILTSCKETLSTATLASVLSTPVVRWTVAYQPVSSALNIIADRASGSVGQPVVWRVLPDGTVWFGVETWPAVGTSFNFTVEDQKPNEHRIELACEAPLVVPGQSLPGYGNVSALTYTFRDDGIRARVFLADS